MGHFRAHDRPDDALRRHHDRRLREKLLFGAATCFLSQAIKQTRSPGPASRAQRVILAMTGNRVSREAVYVCNVCISKERSIGLFMLLALFALGISAFSLSNAQALYLSRFKCKHFWRISSNRSQYHSFIVHISIIIKQAWLEKLLGPFKNSRKKKFSFHTPHLISMSE